MTRKKQKRETSPRVPKPEPHFTVVVPIIEQGPDGEPVLVGYREVAPGELVPGDDLLSELLLEGMRKVFERCRLSADDFDDQEWVSFVRSLFRYQFGDAEGTERLKEVLRGVIRKKFGAVKDQAS